MFLTPDAERTACTVSTLRLCLTLFLVWVYSTRSVSGSAVLHWYRRYVTVKLSVHHSAVVDFEQSTVRKKREGHDHQEMVRGLLMYEVVSMVAVYTQCE